MRTGSRRKRRRGTRRSPMPRRAPLRVCRRAACTPPRGGGSWRGQCPRRLRVGPASRAARGIPPPPRRWWRRRRARRARSRATRRRTGGRGAASRARCAGRAAAHPAGRCPKPRRTARLRWRRSGRTSPTRPDQPCARSRQRRERRPPRRPPLPRWPGRRRRRRCRRRRRRGCRRRGAARGQGCSPARPPRRSAHLAAARAPREGP
mmetsp:Transcript_42840/g.140724  ORF Transcript_42840/g.140724 Transcript_42840/m.140724 type:complete len:206 (+) Transcript_42840:2188-2805(+)